MADDLQSVVSSRENLVDKVDAALADLTSTLLPGFAATVRETEPSRLGALMSHWLNLHLTEDLKGKPLTEALGQIAVMLEEERKSLKDTAEELDRSFAIRAEELETAKTQDAKLGQEEPIHTEIGRLKAKQKRVSEELMAAKDELVMLRQQQVKPEDELEVIRARLEKAQVSPISCDVDVTDIKHELRRSLDGEYDQLTRLTLEAKIYLIKVSASREVSSFIDWQPSYVLDHYEVLFQPLNKEFSNHLSQTGLATALLAK
ncbi:hypothetical protein AOLI_G00066110 [Acnodon oligacanthus]